MGRYELHGELAAGGMATVYLGRSIGAAGFAKCVAIKRLHEPFARDPDFVASLLEEARLSERIRHPNVVATLDVVAAQQELLLVMEYVHGETLARLLHGCARDGTRCPPAIAAGIAHAVLLGLHAAHSAIDASGAPLCIVHRDVSPQNIIVGADGVARLLDFGIAKAAGTASHTREGEVKGKVPYMAPEILRLDPASPQSDLYAVAVTLWESLCAQRLFRGESQIGTWAAVLESIVAPPSSIAGPIGPLDDVVMRGLARSRSERFPTALAMAQALEKSIRLASFVEIAGWVARRAADALAERSAKVHDIERTPPRAIRPATDETPSAARGAVASVRASVVVPPRGRRWVMLGALVVVLATAAFVLAHGHAVRGARAVTLPPFRAPLVVAQAPAESVDRAAAGLLPAPPSTGVERATISAGAPDPAIARSRKASSALGGETVATPSSARPRGAPDPCDPPFTIDEGGRKHFKLNCVN
jgi:hypothetical protein